MSSKQNILRGGGHSGTAAYDLRAWIPEALGVAILLGVLALSLGITSIWLFHKIDQQYTDLVRQSNAALEDIHAITLNSSAVYGAVKDLLWTRDPNDEARLRKVIADHRTANNRLLEELRAAFHDPKPLAALQEVNAARQVFQQTWEEEFARTRSEPAVASSERTQRIMPAFLKYQAARENLCRQIIEATEILNQQNSHTVDRYRGWVLLLIVVPLGGVIVLAGVLFLLLVWVSRSSPEVDFS